MKYAQATAELTALRQRHAEAVEQAYREGYMDFDADPDDHSEAANAGWLASEAKAALEGDYENL